MALSFSWLREIKKELRGVDAIPLTSSPPFPWEELSLHLANTFECDNFNIQPNELAWLTKEELFENLGTPLNTLTFILPSLKGYLYWIMPEEEINVLESLLLTKEVNPYAIQDAEFKKSFYQFLVLETLYTINQTSYDQSLVPIITDLHELPKEDSLCMDITITIDNRLFQGRLVISQPLRHSLANYFSKNGPSISSKKLSGNVEVPMHLEIGRTQLSLEEWKKVALGDFIILDRCSLKSKDLSGHVTLTMEGKPVFRGELEGDHIRILEFPIIHEEDTYMAKHQDNEDDDEDDLSDLGFDDDDDLEEFDEFDDDLFKELEENDQTSLGEINAENKVENETHPPQTDEDQSSFQLTGKGPLTPDQIPVTIVVELGSIQVTMDKLLQIEPGNLLDISVQPENKVDLTINGRVIARAELIRVGENLGVRILELG